eukprot:10372658-Ditylum_brightwellii.AAC.1
MAQARKLFEAADETKGGQQSNKGAAAANFAHGAQIKRKGKRRTRGTTRMMSSGFHDYDDDDDGKSGLVTKTKCSVHPASSPESTANNTVTSTSVEDNKLERKIADETVLHDTVTYMKTPLSPDSIISNTNIEKSGE